MRESMASWHLGDCGLRRGVCRISSSFMITEGMSPDCETRTYLYPPLFLAVNRSFRRESSIQDTPTHVLARQLAFSRQADFNSRWCIESQIAQEEGVLIAQCLT